jgi:hypothetical protein
MAIHGWSSLDLSDASGVRPPYSNLLVDAAFDPMASVSVESPFSLRCRVTPVSRPVS